MIDRYSRDRLAELLRHLVCGQMTNDDFCDTAGKIRWASKDLAVSAIYEYADGLYSDLQTYRLRGPRRISDEHRRQTAIAAMFLYSDLEYEWPETSKAVWRGQYLMYAFGAACIAGLVLGPIMFFWAVGLYPLSWAVHWWERNAWRTQQRELGDVEVWPFLRRADFDRARQFPRLLTGRVREPVA
jgi:hypothetical protein